LQNHLGNEYSPYLKQHAHDPVEWYPWGDEAFSKALLEGKPIFLNIGYSACHRCYVMEQESFKKRSTAKLLNEHFICIKVDKLERPDIDRYFQEVYRLINGHTGGWPTSVFLTQEGKPFYAAAYIPAKSHYDKMDFNALVETIIKKYRDEKKLLTQKADEILRFINPKQNKIEATKLDMSILGRIINHAKELFDSEHGGFSKAPKFPQTSTLSLLLDAYKLTGDKEILHMVLFTLRTMAKGGIRDLIQGGFFRYTTDDAWQIPGFEKTSCDNALITDLYLEAYHISGKSFYKNVAFRTLDFMLKEMREKSLFFATLYANSEDKKSRYFLYTYKEALEAFTQAGIPKKAQARLARALHITEKEDSENQNTLVVENPEHPDIPYYKEALNALAKEREKRPYPSIDTIILLSWNAMMIYSLFKASRIKKSYLPLAIESLDALLERMYINSELYHSTLQNKTPKIKAFLEDYAYLSETLIEAYKSTLNEVYLITAQKLANSAIEKYYYKGKWKFSRGTFETDALVYDTPYPSSVATMISVLHSISSLVDGVYRKFVFRSLEIYSYDIMRQPLSSPRMGKMVLRYLKDDIVVKACHEKLKPHIKDLDTLSYPFSLLKGDNNDGFMLCNSNGCFGYEKDFSGVLEVLKKREQVY